jgi:hypothetical protein
MNSGITKLSPFKKDPKQKVALKVATVASRLKQRAKPPPKMAGG